MRGVVMTVSWALGDGIRTAFAVSQEAPLSTGGVSYVRLSASSSATETDAVPRVKSVSRSSLSHV